MTVKTQHRPEWRFEEAKAKLSQLVDQAKAGTPQLITRRGKEEVVVVSVEKWKALNGEGPKAIELFRHFPKLTEEEHAEFERHLLDRNDMMLQDREIELG